MPNVNEAVFHNDGTCELTRRSPFSGETNTLRFKATRENFESWKKGQMIQVAFSHLDADTREFILTGITAKEWAETFGEDEEEKGECSDTVGVNEGGEWMDSFREEGE